MSRTEGVLKVAVLFGLAGCAGARVEGTAQPLPGGGQGLTLELSNFRFRPNAITVESGRPIAVTASNPSSAPHNVTVVSAAGDVLADVDVPKGLTRTFDVTLPRPGTYGLYCDVGLHRPLGMEGVLVAR